MAARFETEPRSHDPITPAGDNGTDVCVQASKKGDDMPRDFDATRPPGAAPQPVKWPSFPPRIGELEPFFCRFSAFRLPARGCDVLFATYPAGSRIEPHTHPTDNWGVITKGEMILTIEGSEARYRPGDWYHVPAEAVHSARCDADTEQIEFWFTTDTTGDRDD